MADCKPTCEVNPCDTYCLSQELICAWEKYFEPQIKNMINAAKPDTSLIDALLEGISVYDCDDETIYDCDDVVLYPKDGKFYKSLKNDNDRDPQDSGSWEEYDSLKGMMAKVDKLTSKSVLSIDYHASCDGGCVAMAKEGQCVAVKVDTGEVDSCSKPIFEDVYYVSLEGKNIDTPQPDSETWRGPINPCDLFAAICDQLHSIPLTNNTIGG